MVRIKAFRGFLPDPSIAKALISPPYDVLDSTQARAMAAGNPHSFLHVNKPQIDLPPQIDLYSDQVYQKGRTNLLDFINQNWLIQQPSPLLYIYSITMQGRTQYGVVNASSVSDYEQNKIKKHELTRKKKEQDRTKLTDTQGANVGPVFLTYQADDRIDQIVSIVTSRGPFIDVVTDDNIGHSLWKCSEAQTIELVQAFEAVPHSYIADGHHRAASAFNVGKMRKERAAESGIEVTGEQDFNFFLSILFPHNQLRIYDYNRVIKSFEGKSPEQFLEELKENFQVFDIEDPKPAAKHSFSLYLENRWIGFKIKPEKITGNDPVSLLDSYLLTELCLKPILGIEDLTTHENIDFVGGIRGLGELERRCGLDCVCGIAMFPCSIEEMMALADAGQIMPPKSTWFEPKARSGLVVKIFENN